MLSQIKILDTSSNPRKVVLWAIAGTAFFGLFCLGERLMDFNPAVNLAWGDIAVMGSLILGGVPHNSLARQIPAPALSSEWGEGNAP